MPGLGRHVEHDERSRGFAAARAPIPRSVLWPHHAPVLDQGDTSSCTGHALAQALNTDYFAKCRSHYLTHDDALNLYAVATQIDNIPGAYPPDDTGSSGLAVCKAGRRMGYLSGYRHAFSFNQFASALQLQPVIVGTNWYQGMSTPDAKGYVTPTGNLDGGHEYLALGIDYERKAVTFLNSWGDQWGKQGRFYMTFSVFTDLLGERGDATAPVAIR